jgi:hypothetical protein
MNEWNYDATCTRTSLPVSDLENCKRFIFGVPWTNIHSLHRPMNTQLFSVPNIWRLAIRYQTKFLEIPRGRSWNTSWTNAESDGGEASKLLICIFKLAKEINEWLSEETSEDRWKTIYFPKTVYIPTVGDQFTDVWWLLRTERTGYYQSLAQQE